MKKQIETLAKECGFVLSRVTRPVLAKAHAQGLQRWTDTGMQADMSWMAEEMRMQRRLHPESLLAGVRSVIAVAMAYTPPEYDLMQANAAKKQGVIATYAHGDDYHEVMKKRLKVFAAALDTMLGKHDQRVFVDTAPVLEHALAEASGLGWQGKHSLTIHRGLGSWFLLGEIFTTAEIMEDEPASNHCGSCSACIDVCPTRAIVAPYVVDARLCISYLTIEFDGFIARDLRSLMGNRIYGCDDCQLVCPWNNHATSPYVARDDLHDISQTIPQSVSETIPQATSQTTSRATSQTIQPTDHGIDPLKPKRENYLPDLASLLQLDDDGFRQWFRKSPVKRTKRAGLLRNVCIAMGNSGSLLFVDDLLRVLDDDEALIRGHAAWALSCLLDINNYHRIYMRLNACLKLEKNDEVYEEMNLTIEYLRSKYDNT